MRISRVDISKLRNDAHFQFHTEFRDLVVREGADYLKIKPQFESYGKLYEREDGALKRVNKSALTPKIHAADKARDDVFIGMVEMVRAACRHYDRNIADAAKRIMVVFDTYGNITQKPLNDQTSAVYNLMQELNESRYGGDRDALGLDPWLVQLKARNDDFDKLMKERYDETASKSGVVVKKARREIDESFRQICKIIDVYVLLEGAQKYERFIRTINAVIAKYGGKTDRRGASAAPAGEQEDQDGADESASVGGGSHGGGANGGIQYEPPLYNPDKHYSEYHIGDVVRMPNGDIYRVISLSHVHLAPDSENGRHSWEKV